MEIVLQRLEYITDKGTIVSNEYVRQRGSILILRSHGGAVVVAMEQGRLSVDGVTMVV